MKKVLALTLTMAMLFTMTAMAEENIIVSGDTTKDVIATYKEGTDGGTIYSVDIVWGSMAFTYNAESKGVWNPETHTYTDSAEAEWSCEEGADTIVVTNHSNAAINVEMNYTAAEGFEMIEGTLSNPSFELANADGVIDIGTLTDESKLQLSGILATGVSETKIGNISIVIDGISEENIKDENEIVLTPMISGMKVVSDINEYDEVGLTIDITGENLSMLNKDNFDQYSKIYFNNKTNTFLEVSNSTSNSYINLYIDDTGKQLTLEYGVGYFTKKSINDDITVLSYETIGNNGEIIQFYPKG